MNVLNHAPTKKHLPLVCWIESAIESAMMYFQAGPSNARTPAPAWQVGLIIPSAAWDNRYVVFESWEHLWKVKVSPLFFMLFWMLHFGMHMYDTLWGPRPRFKLDTELMLKWLLFGSMLRVLFETATLSLTAKKWIFPTLQESTDQLMHLLTWNLQAHAVHTALSPQGERKVTPGRWTCFRGWW